MTQPTTRLRSLLEALAAEFASTCAQTCYGYVRSRDRHASNCPLAGYGADVAEALEAVAELERGKRTPPTWESECRARLAAYEAALNGDGTKFTYSYEELRNWAYSDLKSALEELDAERRTVAALRVATLAEAVQAVDALEPEAWLGYDSAAGFRDGINAALGGAGGIGGGMITRTQWVEIGRPGEAPQDVPVEIPVDLARAAFAGDAAAERQLGEIMDREILPRLLQRDGVAVPPDATVADLRMLANEHLREDV